MFDSYPESERPILQSAYNVITTMKKWSFLHLFSFKTPILYENS